MKRWPWPWPPNRIYSRYRQLFVIALLFTFTTFLLLYYVNFMRTGIVGSGEVGYEPYPPELDQMRNRQMQLMALSNYTRSPRRGIWLVNSNNANGSSDEDYEPTGEDEPSAGQPGHWQREDRGIDPRTLVDLLPHLRRVPYRNLKNLNAIVHLRANNLLRSPPELLLLIPSTHRKEYNYLVDTLSNLVKNMAEEERHLAQIVVMISENPWDDQRDAYLTSTVVEIGDKFAREVEQGLIEVISPPQHWFPPNLAHISPTLGDSPERMRWRTKQNFDYAFAMLHVNKERPNARYYVQLEDDILTVPGFLSEMQRFASQHSAFFMCEFSNLGFIGRMFHNNKDLNNLAHFILLLHRSLPVDWILAQTMTTKFCSLDDSSKDCFNKHLNDIVLFRRSPPLFQHVGRHSSLPGKLQNLAEKKFEENKKIEVIRSENPVASKFSTFSSSPSNGNDSLRLDALYQQYYPYQMDLTKDNWLQIDFNSGKPLSELKALRILYSVRFISPLHIVGHSLPRSLLSVSIKHHPATAGGGQSAFPPKQELLLLLNPDHFLLDPWPNRLFNVSSIWIGFSSHAGNHDWLGKVTNFTITAIRVLN